MSIKDHWNSVLALLGLSSEGEALTEGHIDLIDPELRERAEKIVAEQEAEEFSVKLRERVDTLEAQRRRQEAQPTQTLPTEDPSAGDVPRGGTNSEAYLRDVRGFKKE